MIINIYAAPYLVNGDASGMEDSELAQIDDMLADITGDLILTDAEPYWARCEITGLWSDCHTYIENNII